MTCQLIVASAAEGDLTEAFTWYEAQVNDLGHAFVAAVEEVMRSIAENPHRYRVVHGELRRALVRRFPYAVFYRCVDRAVIVVAILHAAQDRTRLDTR